MTLVPVSNGTSLTEAVPIDHAAILRALNINVSDPKAQAMILACQKYGLDPLLKHAVLISGNLYVTRDGLLAIAHRSGLLDGIVIEDEGETAEEWWAKVTVHVKDVHYGYTYRGRYPKSGQMKKYGPEMAVKVAEVMALRRAFGVTGVPTVEEQWDVMPLATPAQVARIDELLPLVPEAVMPELKAWKAEQNISMKAGEFTAADADLVVAKLEELAHSLPVEEPTPTASAGAGDGNDKGTDDGTLTGVGASLTVPEVSDGGGFVPPAPAVGVRTGGEGSPHESDGVGIPSTVPAPTPSGVSPEPGGEPEPSEHSPAAEEPQTADSHPAAPAGPDTLKTINERAYQSLNRKCRAIHAEHGDPDKETKRVQWEALAWACSGGRTVHLGEMSPDECSVFRTRMVDVSEGRATWAESNDPAFLGWTLAYKEADQ